MLPNIASESTTHYITVVVMIRNEGPYLKEWLDFHIALGVTRFILYDNGSTDHTVRVCEPYIRAGLVTLVPWANFSVWFNHQRGAYAHALANFGTRTTWMGFFDIDEFMVPVAARSLTDILQPREHLPVLLVAGVNFGTSGHAVKPDGGVIRNYRMSVPMHVQRRHRELINTKCFVRPQCVEAVISLHWFRIRGDKAVGYTEHSKPIYGRPCTAGDQLSVDVIRYNHYFTRSREEFEHKILGPDARGPLWYAARADKLRMFDLIESLVQEDRVVERLANEISLTRPQRECDRNSVDAVHSTREPSNDESLPSQLNDN